MSQNTMSAQHTPGSTAKEREANLAAYERRKDELLWRNREAAALANGPSQVFGAPSKHFPKVGS